MKPSAEDRKIIRQCAERAAKKSRVVICASDRISLTTGEHSMNIAQVSDDPHWEDTDLYDNSFSWKDWEIDFTEDGRSIFDFWVYSTGRNGELETNVTAFYENRQLVRVEGTGDGILWRR